MTFCGRSEKGIVVVAAMGIGRKHGSGHERSIVVVICECACGSWWRSRTLRRLWSHRFGS
jgi:hypothetical protein